MFEFEDCVFNPHFMNDDKYECLNDKFIENEYLDGWE